MSYVGRGGDAFVASTLAATHTQAHVHPSNRHIKLPTRTLSKSVSNFSMLSAEWQINHKCTLSAHSPDPERCIFLCENRSFAARHRCVLFRLCPSFVRRLLCTPIDCSNWRYALFYISSLRLCWPGMSIDWNTTTQKRQDAKIASLKDRRPTVAQPLASSGAAAFSSSRNAIC